jgi:hypothetical protein
LRHIFQADNTFFHHHASPLFVKKNHTMKQRVYVDTSIVGGYFATEFSKDTIPFFESVENGERIILLSDVLDKELRNAPMHVKQLLQTMPSASVEKVVMTPEAEWLANSYIEAKVVGKSSLDDCRHIAIATLCKADVLASWNFKHIVNLTRIKGYNAINLLHGYSTIEIRTPKELMNYGT